MNKMRYMVGAVVLLLTLVLYWKSPEMQPSSKMVDVDIGKMAATPLAGHRTLAPDTIAVAVRQSATDGVPLKVLRQLPKSLRGVPLPETLSVDERGALVINQAIQKLFDFYLTAIGEESLQLIIARIKHQLNGQLDEPALAESLVILEGYLQYRNHLATILNESQAEVTQDPRSVARLELLRQQISAAREQFLGPRVIEAFFERQDQYDEYMLARQAILNDDGMSLSQQQQARSELDRETSQWLIEQQHSAGGLNRFYQQQQKLLTQPGGEDAIQVLRETSFGIEAADRLARLDEKRQQWHSKLSDYHQQLKTLLDNSSADDETRQQQITQLRQQYFSENELRRVDAIDRHKFGF